MRDHTIRGMGHRGRPHFHRNTIDVTNPTNTTTPTADRPRGRHLRRDESAEFGKGGFGRGGFGRHHHRGDGGPSQGGASGSQPRGRHGGGRLERGPRHEHGGDLREHLDHLRQHGFGGRRSQMRRGALREAVLSTLAEQPMHGYQIIQTLEEQTGGRWRPSAGSIYPTLQLLEDERLVTATEVEGRKTYELTPTGREAVAKQPSSPDWRSGRQAAGDLRGLTKELAVAAMQVARVGSPAAIEAARTTLTAARRDLYRLLADDSMASPADDDTIAAGPDPNLDATAD
jgi:DNA-binding PadR family transcriptional regulator